jgi:hypothetical protein
MSAKRASPVVLFRDKSYGKLVIADGDRRLCAVYTCDEAAMVPSEIVGAD